MKVRVLLLLVLSVGTITLYAQQENLESVKAKIKELSEIEIDAFKNGDCEIMLNLLDDNISFYANGKKASKEMVLGFCKGLPRPFEKPSHLDIEYIPISSNSAYVIRIMDFSKDGMVYKKEIVTKIWVKGIDGWKIVHLHSTIKEL
ncbi:MAG: nuclear transport factor 2 family protein [Cyclobacteriaceae bacterium]